ncbi:Uncharacterised protein [Klebsiella pneumoniae]|nr:Uncharacterised protein [Klebsiella pneumoniae]
MSCLIFILSFYLIITHPGNTDPFTVQLDLVPGIEACLSFIYCPVNIIGRVQWYVLSVDRIPRIDRTECITVLFITFCPVILNFSPCQQGVLQTF